MKVGMSAELDTKGAQKGKTPAYRHGVRATPPLIGERCFLRESRDEGDVPFDFARR